MARNKRRELHSPSEAPKADNAASFVSSSRELVHAVQSGRLSVPELYRQCGQRGAWVILLELAVQAKIPRQIRGRHPARIFISYRWESEEHIKWVGKLAEALRDFGYDVILDKWNRVECNEDVPRFIAEVTRVDAALIVATEAYLESVRGLGEERAHYVGWLFDEYALIDRMRARGQLEMIAVLRSGDQYPDTCSRAIDARDVTDDFTLICAQVEHNASRLTVKQQARLDRAIDVATRKPARAGAMFRYVEREQALAATEEAALIEARAALRAKDTESVKRLCATALARGRNVQVRIEVAELLARVGERRLALKLLTPYARHRVSELQCHFLMGNILDDLDNVAAAINHYRYAITVSDKDAQLWNNLGYALSREGATVEAEFAFCKALELMPKLEIAWVNYAVLLAAQGKPVAERDDLMGAGPLRGCGFQNAVEQRRKWLIEKRPRATRRISCDKCPSDYPAVEQATICGDCGALDLVAQPAIRCSMCTQENLLRLNSVLVSVSRTDAAQSDSAICPVCGTGQLRLGSATSS